MVDVKEEVHFKCKHQEIHDANTNVTVAFGTHDVSDKNDPSKTGTLREGLRWMRIAVPYGAGTPDDPQATMTATSTITFGPDGQVLNILPHVGSATVDEGSSHKTEKKPDKIEEPHSTSGSEAARQADTSHPTAGRGKK